jgi:hypothetical protein
MAATCPTSCSTPRTSPAPCAPAPACGLELARSSTASPKKILPLMAASAVRKNTSGELVSSPAGSSSRRAITTSPSPEVFSDKNAKNCSVTRPHSDPCFYVTRRKSKALHQRCRLVYAVSNAIIRGLSLTHALSEQASELTRPNDPRHSAGTAQGLV